MSASSDCLREVLAAIAEATPDDLAAVKKLLKNKSGRTVRVAASWYVFIEGVGYVMSYPDRCSIIHNGSRFTQIGVELADDAVIKSATPESMTICNDHSTVEITFTKDYVAHLRITRIEVRPHTPSLSEVLSEFEVPTVLRFNQYMKIVSMDLIGETSQDYYTYVNDEAVSIKTVSGSRVRIVDYSSGSTKKFRQLHPEVTFAKDVFTLQVADARVQATLVGAPLDPEATPGRLCIKDGVFTFTWGSSMRVYKVVPAADGYTLETVLGMDSYRDRTITCRQMHPDVKRYSDGTYVLTTEDGDIKYTPLNYAYRDGKIIQGRLDCQRAGQYVFLWLGKTRTYTGVKDAAGETMLERH